MPASQQPEEHETAKESHIGCVSIHQQMHDGPQYNSHEQGMTGNALYAPRPSARGAGHSRRAGAKESCHHQHQSDGVADPGDDVDDQIRFDSPIQLPQVLIAHINHNQRHEDRESHQSVEALKQPLAQQAHGLRAKRVTGENDMGQGEHCPESNYHGNRGHFIDFPGLPYRNVMLTRRCGYASLNFRRCVLCSTLDRNIMARLLAYDT